MSEEMDSLVETVLSEFVIGLPDGLGNPFDESIATIPPELAEIGGVFKDNLRGALTVATLPFQMSQAVVVETYVALIEVAERIRDRPRVRAGNHDPEGVRKRVNERLTQEISNEDSPLVERTVRRLNASLDDPSFAEAARELLMQTHVAIWSSFEVLVSDLVRHHLNRNPELAATLLTDENARRHFPSKGVSVEALAAHGFDISARMGDLLVGERQIDSLPMMRDLLEAILVVDDDLRRELHSDDLWMLWQRRHLIVHRRGVVDRAYLEKTGDHIPVGQRIAPSAHDIEAAAERIRGLGLGILRAKLTNA